MLIESRQATLLIESASRKKKKPFLLERNVFQLFQLDETKTIDNIFAFNIICFNVSTKSLSTLLVLVLDLVVPELMIVLVSCLVLCLALPRSLREAESAR